MRSLPTKKLVRARHEDLHAVPVRLRQHFLGAGSEGRLRHRAPQAHTRRLRRPQQRRQWYDLGDGEGRGARYEVLNHAVSNKYGLL